MFGPGFGAGCPVILAPVVFPFGFMDRLLPGDPIRLIHFTRKNLIALRIFFETVLQLVQAYGMLIYDCMRINRIACEHSTEYG